MGIVVRSMAQWDAYRFTLRFPVRRAAVSLGGWSARPFETSNGTWFWRRLLIPMETEPCRHACSGCPSERYATRSLSIPQRASKSLRTRAGRTSAEHRWAPTVVNGPTRSSSSIRAHQFQCRRGLVPRRLGDVAQELRRRCDQLIVRRARTGSWAGSSL